MDDRIYVGRRKACGNVEVYVGDGHGKIEKLLPGPSQALWNHSPGGFEWGYEGSGPSRLSLALLFDVTGDRELSVTYHQEFKRHFVAGWRKDYWAVTADSIRDWLRIRELISEYERQLGVG